MKEIELTKGMVAIVDDEDFEYLNQFSWYLSSHGYAVTNCASMKHTYMHRLINNTEQGLLTDHIDMNKLDNRRCNLRTVDKRGNSINRLIQPNNTSGHRGISWDKHANKWEAYIWKYGHKIRLGCFSNIEEAVLVRQKEETLNYAI